MVFLLPPIRMVPGAVMSPRRHAGACY